jgi:argininosuccinate lyase
MLALSRSTQFDWRLAPYDLAGSTAHARALHRAGLLTDEELDGMLDGIGKLAGEVEVGGFRPADGDEDVHGALERRLVELVGAELGGRLRAGRSRNDQIATDRMYLRMLSGRSAGLLEVIDACAGRPARHLGVAMPGRTTCSMRKPILLSHHLLAHAWPLLRDCDRIRDLDRRLAVSPRRSAALAAPRSASILRRWPRSWDSPAACPTRSTARLPETWRPRRRTCWRRSGSTCPG